MPVPFYDFIPEDLESVTIACDHMESLLREEIFLSAAHLLKTSQDAWPY
jgi:hypothetical protein